MCARNNLKPVSLTEEGQMNMLRAACSVYVQYVQTARQRVVKSFNIICYLS